jgi:hypothetical protein
MNRLEAEYRIWIANNPMVMVLFKKYTLEAMRSGRKRFGVAMIFERMRWYTSIETYGEASGDEFKLNNNYRAYIVRDFIAQYPAAGNFFETRELRSP